MLVREYEAYYLTKVEIVDLEIVDLAKEAIWLCSLVNEQEVFQNQVELHCDNYVLFIWLKIRCFMQGLNTLT